MAGTSVTKWQTNMTRVQKSTLTTVKHECIIYSSLLKGRITLLTKMQRPSLGHTKLIIRLTVGATSICNFKKKKEIHIPIFIFLAKKSVR